MWSLVRECLPLSHFFQCPDSCLPMRFLGSEFLPFCRILSVFDLPLPILFSEGECPSLGPFFVLTFSSRRDLQEVSALQEVAFVSCPDLLSLTMRSPESEIPRSVAFSTCPDLCLSMRSLLAESEFFSLGRFLYVS